MTHSINDPQLDRAYLERLDTNNKTFRRYTQTNNVLGFETTQTMCTIRATFGYTRQVYVVVFLYFGLLWLPSGI